MNTPQYGITVAQQKQLLKVADLLEQGTYDQGYKALHITDEDGNDYFCCLGLMCHVVNPTAWAEKIHILEGYDRYASEVADVSVPVADGEEEPGSLMPLFFDDGTGDPNATELPLHVQELYGINSGGDIFAFEGAMEADDLPDAFRLLKVQRLALFNMNDEGKTFPQIAAAIRYVLAHPDRFRFMPPGFETNLFTNFPLRPESVDARFAPLPPEPMIEPA